MEKEIYDIVECRFVDNRTDKVFRVNQYCHGENEIEEFWKKYFHDPNKDTYTFISCKTIQKNVEVVKQDLTKKIQEILNEKNKLKI